MKKQNTQFTMTHRLLLGGGMLLLIMVGALTSREVASKGVASVWSVMRILPAFANLHPLGMNPTTCGTYTSPDGGITEPFAENGQVDPECDNSPQGVNVCHNATAGKCFAQGSSPITPPFALLTQSTDPRYWSAKMEFWNDTTLRIDSYYRIHYVLFDSANPDNWKCIYGTGWGTGESNYCSSYDNIQMMPVRGGEELKTHHIADNYYISSNQDWYAAIELVLSDGTVLRSEIRTFNTHVENFTLTSPTPSALTVTTGELSNYYSINVVPEGGYTGTVSLTGLNLPPSTSIQWEGGNSVVFNNGDTNPKSKRFRLQTTAGQPPQTPSGLYTFQIRGTDGERIRDNATPSPQLVVQDYGMTIDDATDITIPMSPGGVATKTIEFERLPTSQPYDFPVNLTTNETLSWLTVSFNDSQISDSDPSPQVTLTTTGAAPQGPFSFKIIGTGTNPGQLRREITVNLQMAGAPDFIMTVDPEPLIVQQGLTGYYNLRMNAINSPPGGMVINLVASHELAGGLPDSPPLDLTYVFKNRFTGAQVSQVTLAADGSVNSDITLETHVQSNAVCNSNPASEYTVRVTGTYNPGSSQVQKTASNGLNVLCPAAPIFNLTANPTTRTVNQGDLATYTITAQASGGFADFVDLSAINCPSNATCSFAGGQAFIDLRSTTSGTRDFLIQTSSSISGGNYYPRVHGTDRGGNAPDDEVQVELIVSEPIGFPTVTVTPNPLAMNEGETASYTLDVQRNGYAEPIVVSWTPASITNVLFVPASGSLVFGASETQKTVQVQSSSGSAGTYSLTFMFQNENDPTEFQTIVVGLTIWSVSCSGDCQNVCVDDNNIPGTPPVFCPNGQSDCPSDTRCASQTCGVDGCRPDPLPGLNDCNADACYNADGSFIVPATTDECRQSWPRCEDYTVLKVKKDRQCEQWLDCSSSVTFENPATGKLEQQCTALGLCTQLGPDGRCAYSPQQGSTNQQTFNSPADVTGATSKIRWFSGYSSGYHFSESNQITTPYKASFVQETGLDGATVNDLVQNGSFEELRCLGGGRDNKACIVSSDCRVGEGVCVQNEEPEDPGASSGLPCQSDNECEGTQSGNGVATLNCRYLTSWGTDVDCRNPRDTKWLGVVAPDAGNSSTLEEAGFGFRAGDSNYISDIQQGYRRSSAGDITMHWEVWEDEENFLTQDKSRTPAVAGTDPRYPPYSTERHLKDGNNNIKVELKSGTKAFSGVGVPLRDTLVAGGNGYVVSFKYKTSETAEAPTPIQVQLGLNYEQRGTVDLDGAFNGYNLSPADKSFIDVGTIAGRTVCSANPATTCSTNNDCSAVGGTCVDTTDWQEFVMGPIAVPVSDYDPSLTPVLSFVTTKDIDADAPPFYLDNVSMKPALEYAKYDEPSLELLKIARTCRLFPRDDSPECDYLDENLTRYKGWRGYCLDKDPKNEDLCLTWWPLDILAGEGLFAVSGQQGWTGASQLYYCMEQEGGPTYADQSFNIPHLDDYGKVTWNTTNGTTKTEWNHVGDFSSNGTGDTAQIRLKDIERIDILYDINDDKWNGCDVRGAAATCESGNHGGSAENTMLTLYPDQFNQVAGDDGYRATQAVFGHSDGALHTASWNTIWNDSCSNSGFGGDSDQYFAARFSFSNPGDPDSAMLSKVELKVCDDRDNELDNESNYRIVIRTRQTCNYIVKTVNDDAGTPEEKSWAGRVNRFSNYSVPGLDIRFGQDAEPFGAINPPTQSDPVNWSPAGGWAPSGAGPSGFQSIEPGTGSQLSRAGTPYSSHRDPIANGTSTQEQKFCFNPTAPAGPGDIGSQLNLNNSCETAGDVTSCRGAGGTCIGRPANRCSGNLLFPCATDNDCSSLGFGQCIGSVDAGYDAGLRLADAKQRLQRLFAASYGIWRLDAEFVDPDPSVPGTGVRTRYVSDNTQAWDIASDGAECPGGVRPSGFTTEYCFVKPRVEQLTINGQSNGDIHGNVGVPLNVRFSYTVNEQQKPAVQYHIQTDGGACGTDGYDEVPPGSNVDQAINYSLPGTYTPRICIVDNWKIVGEIQYPGNIIIE